MGTYGQKGSSRRSTQKALSEFKLRKPYKKELTMASAATILLSFENDVSVTVQGNGTWYVTSDPKGVLDLDSGDWKYTVTAGTELIAGGETQVVLVGFQLSTTPPGSKEGGDAYRFPGQQNELGTFKVTVAV